MDVKSMGSELLDADEAATILEVTVKTVRRMARSGLLTAQTTRTGARFDRREVLALAEVRTLKELDLAKVAQLAARAFVQSRMAEQQLKQLCLLLGAESNPLDTSEEEVVRQFIQTEEALNAFELELSAADVLHWGRVFLNVSESYLDLVNDYVAPPEPWSVFMNLANRISDSAPRSRFRSDLELESAYSYFEVARRSLRHAVFFYISHRHGASAAKKMFPAVGEDYKARLIASLFPH